MPLNTTVQERQETALIDLALKMKLEVRFTRELRELFSAMSRDMAAAINQTGTTQEASIYLDDFMGLLTRHYRRVNDQFSNRIFDFLEDNKDNEDEPIIAALIVIAATRGISLIDLIGEMRAQMRIVSQNLIQTNSQVVSRQITTTNQNQMDTALAVATGVLLDRLGREPTNKEVSSVAAKDFRTKGFVRSNTIAVTETQKAAEGTKEIERRVFVNTRNGLSAAVANIKPLQFIEIWVTIGDAVVRPSHVEADGSKKTENGVFIVQGQFLQFPGDTSLGATPDNVIGCRCSAVAVIDDSFESIPTTEILG